MHTRLGMSTETIETSLRWCVVDFMPYVQLGEHALTGHPWTLQTSHDRVSMPVQPAFTFRQMRQAGKAVLLITRNCQIE